MGSVMFFHFFRLRYIITNGLVLYISFIIMESEPTMVIEENTDPNLHFVIILCSFIVIHFLP